MGLMAILSDGARLGNIIMESTVQRMNGKYNAGE